MFDSKMFYTKTLITDEEAIEVLDTIIPIDRSIVPESLYVYHMIRKGNPSKTNYMVSDTPSEDYETTIISHKELTLGDTVRLETEPGSSSYITMNQYQIETIGHPIIYVSGWFPGIRRTYAQDEKDFKLLISKCLKRSPEDVGVILSKSSAYNSIDNFTIELKRMNAATHILDLTYPYSIPIPNSEPAHVLAETARVFNKYPLQKDRVLSRIHDNETRQIMNNLKRFTGGYASLNTFTPSSPYNLIPYPHPRFDEYGNIAVDEDEE